MVETGAVVTAASESILAQRARGGLSPGMALMRLLLVHRDVEAVRRTLAAVGDDGHTAESRRDAACELATLLEARLDTAGEVVAVADRADEDGYGAASGPEAGIERCRRLFDWAVGVNAEASVALYSLGTAALLEPATDEAAGLMSALGVVGSDRHVLDVGCGIGRFELALARRVASITGIDVSTAMIDEACRRCEALANVRLLPTSGRDLRPFADASFDAAVAVDSFPYLYQAGGTTFAGAYLGEVARVLRPGGDALVLNLSYRGDAARDVADARDFAEATGLRLLRAGAIDLRHWDGRTFHWRKPG